MAFSKKAQTGPVISIEQVGKLVLAVICLVILIAMIGSLLGFFSSSSAPKPSYEADLERIVVELRSLREDEVLAIPAISNFYLYIDSVDNVKARGYDCKSSEWCACIVDDDFDGNLCKGFTFRSIHEDINIIFTDSEKSDLLYLGEGGIVALHSSQNKNRVTIYEKRHA